MNIQVNGEAREIEPGRTLYQLLLDLHLDPEQKGIAVALDEEVVFKRDWKEVELQPGSGVEIIRAVAGGG